MMLMNRLIRLYEEFDQSPWLDNLRRGYLTSGQLVASVTMASAG